MVTLSGRHAHTSKLKLGEHSLDGRVDRLLAGAQHQSGVARALIWSTDTGQFRQTVGLPGARRCVRRHTLRIVLRNPAYDPLKEVVVHVGRHKLADVRDLKKLTKPIVLKRLPGGSFKVKVLAITVLDQRLSGIRTYRSCKSTKTGRIKLHRVKPRRGHG